MPIVAIIEYTKKVESLGYGKYYFSLYPDIDINKFQNKPFNWLGLFELENGEKIDVVVPQINSRIDPEEDCFQLDNRLPFTKNDVLNSIKKALDKNFQP
ncbi:MAG: hypothetical protein U0V04_19030 [Spirosomataceae bacterium]